MSEKYKGILSKETDKALLVEFHDLPNDAPIWIPRSVVDKLLKIPRAKGGYFDVELTLPFWKAKELGLE